MKRSTLRLLRRVLPESPARTRVRIKLTARLNKLFYQGAHPLLAGTSGRDRYIQQADDDAELYSITKCPRLAEYYGFA